MLNDINLYTAAAANVVAARGAQTVVFVAEGYPGLITSCEVDHAQLGLRRLTPSGANVTAYPIRDSPERNQAVDAFFAFVQQEKPDVVALCATYESSIWFLNRAKAQNIDANAFVLLNVVTDPRFASEKSLAYSYAVDRASWFPRNVYNKPVLADDPCTALSPIGCVDGAMLDTWITQQYGATIPLEHTYPFATFQVISQAIVGAGTDVVADIISVLRSTQFSTILGDTYFGRTTHMSARETFIRQVQVEGVKLVAPVQFANGVLVY
ncbi:hypothetical protein EON66_06090, partial [archaeon]